MTRRDILTIILIITALFAGYYLISPIWDVKELDEPLPALQIDDNLFSMDAKTMEQFNKEMLEANDGSPEVMNEGLEDAPFALLGQGTLVARAHNVKGTVALLDVGGEKYLRFENLETINGPNLHIYLSTGLSDKDIVDLGPIRGTRGNINYPIGASVDTTKYRYVLIWCVPFRILFSYAELTQGFQPPSHDVTAPEGWQ